MFDLSDALFVMAGTAALSLVTTGLISPLLRRLATVTPSARSSHSRPTPQGAGLTVIGAAWAVSVVACTSIGVTGWGSVQTWPLLSAVLLMMVVGLSDDLFGVHFLMRLVLQFIAAILVLYALPEHGFIFADVLPPGIERVLIVCATVWFINLTNFMDGIDWLTFTEFSSICLGIAAVHVFGGIGECQAVVALALLGALLGFAPYNAPPARLFLGDVGSLGLGIMTAWLLISLAVGGHLVAALLLPLYHLMDATITLFRRAVRLEVIWRAHREHFYQQAVDGGIGVGRVNAVVLGLNALLVALAVTSVVFESAPWVPGACLATGLLATTTVIVRFAQLRPNAAVSE